MTFDPTKLLSKLLPDVGGEDVVRMRTGIVDAVNADGTVDLGIAGIIVPDIPVLQGAYAGAGAVVNVISFRGSLLVIGGTTPTTGGAGATSVMAFNSGAGTVVGTAYLLPTTTNIGLAFIAPPSGKVRLDWSAEISSSIANVHCLLSPRILTGSSIGSGSVVLAPSDSIACRHRPTVVAGTGGDTGVSNFYLLTGLTSGAAYNAQLYGRINTAAQTATFELQRLLVSPAA